MKLDIKKFPNLTLLNSKTGVISLGKKVTIYSPICPDYHFKEIVNPIGQKERIHDFDGLGVEKGIVYEKLIRDSGELLDYLEDNDIQYKHVLLVADVEVKDQTILKKLQISAEEFISCSTSTEEKINQDLICSGRKYSICDLMGNYFKTIGYDFSGNIKVISARILGSSDLARRVEEIRFPLHHFWFGLSKEKSLQRSIDEIAMYASFGSCPQISSGIILCADSEILSHCYNVNNSKRVPVIYVSGSY